MGTWRGCTCVATCAEPHKSPVLFVSHISPVPPSAPPTTASPNDDLKAHLVHHTPLDKPFGTFSSFPPPTRNDTMPPKYRIEVTCPKHFYTSLFGKKHAVPVNIRVYENSTKRLATYVHGCTGARVFAVRCVLYAVVRLAAVAAAVAAAVCSGIG